MADMLSPSRRRLAVPPRGWVLLGLALVLLALPPIAKELGEPFYISLISRVMVFALAAISLDLLLGYGGLVCFGHAAFLGVGAYTVAILSHHAAENTLFLGFLPGTNKGWIAWPLAMLTSAALAVPIGWISLRTRGIHFIMITLAFAQMVYFYFVTLKTYGGDDGLSLSGRSDFGEWLPLRDKTIFYYVVLFLLAACGYLVWRITNARFGQVLSGARENERRMTHLGFPVYRYRLTAFVLAGAIAGLAGALMANQANFVSPAMMHWTRSGELIAMVVLGGMGSLIGPIFGAFGFLLLEELLSDITEHWQLIFGPLLLIVILYARRGLIGLIPATVKRGAKP